MPSLLPREDSREPLPISETPVRVFRVTLRDIHESTTLRVADSPEDAVVDARANVIAQLSRDHIHETVECVELIAQGTQWRSMPESS